MANETPSRSTRFHGRPLSRAALRDKIGPDNPLYPFLEIHTNEVAYFEDDFIGAVDTNKWTLTNNGTSAANFVAVAGAGGIITGTSGTDDDGYAAIRQYATVAIGPWRANHRATAIFRVRQPTAITTSKFEIGFKDTDADAGAVNAKDTPTSTAADYAVLIRDTDGATNPTLLGLVTDGTTPAASIQDIAAASLTWAVDTWYTVQISLTEANVARVWINGALKATSTTGPDDDVGLGLWGFIQARDSSASRTLNLDYVRAFQERTGL